MQAGFLWKINSQGTTLHASYTTSATLADNVDVDCTSMGGASVAGMFTGAAVTFDSLATATTPVATGSAYLFKVWRRCI